MYDTCNFKFISFVFRRLVSMSQKTQCLSITKANWLMLDRDIICVYSENHMNSVHTLYRQNSDSFNVESADIYSNHNALKG